MQENKKDCRGENVLARTSQWAYLRMCGAWRFDGPLGQSRRLGMSVWGCVLAPVHHVV